MILDPDGSGVGSRIIGRTERHFATGGRVTARLMSVALVLSLVLCMFWSQSSVDLSRMSRPRNSDPDLSTAPSTEIATGGSPPGKSDSITEYDWPML